MKIDADGWVYCPKCGGKTALKVKLETVIKNHDLYCKKCKQTTNINIENLKLTRA